MQFHLSKQNSISTSQKINLSNTGLLIGIGIITITLTAMFLIPGYSSFITGTLVIAATIRHLVHSINKKPLLLEITNEGISYLSEESNELIFVQADEIVGINHKFCELVINTRDGNVHKINLLNTSSEQDRWEIKEHVKGLTAQIQRESDLD
jgi:hypothetical protein